MSNIHADSYSAGWTDGYEHALREVRQKMAMVPEAVDARRKLTDAQVREIRELKASGWIQKSLAEKFGVSQTQISLIVRGKSR